LSDSLRNAIIVGLAALLAAAVVAIVLERHGDEPALEINLAELTPTPGGPIQVYITGAVAHPGVYEMQDGDRVVDALYEAGGPVPEANLEAVNLALRLHDEDQVVIPRQGQPVASTGSRSQVSSGEGSGSISVPSGPININTATAEELDAYLPGIGEVYSNRIVQSRAADGPFTSPDDLIIRQLIPRATYENIRELITVGP
jgi:competence protein ComEA